MGVFKRGRSWCIDFYDQHGRRRKKTIGPSKKLAEKVYAKIIGEVAEKRFLDVKPDSKTTFKELAAEYRAHVGSRPSFDRHERYRLNQLENHFGDKLLAQITTHDVEKLKQKVAANGKVGWNRMRAMLHRMFELGKKWGHCEQNPASGVERFKESPGKTRFLFPDDELPRFLGAASEPDMEKDARALMVVSVFTGMRRSETFRLRWDEVDFKVGTIHVSRESKGRRSREIPMTRQVRQALLEQRERTGDQEYVFCRKDGQPFKDRRGTLQTVLKRAGIKNFTWHDMRHCFGSYLAMAGVDLLRIKELMGHSDIKMTLRYAHLSPSYLRESVRALDRLAPAALPAHGASPTPEEAFDEAPDDQKPGKASRAGFLISAGGLPGLHTKENTNE